MEMLELLEEVREAIRYSNHVPALRCPLCSYQGNEAYCPVCGESGISVELETGEI